ncbi:hypothetical protein DVDV_4321 [Desulfovibrio sp. DV]|uniref:hypothetical protein n=1 Tax=Desulfovibrio sp. DV TaxID=1844708 RepID=UPI00094B93E0|nr:hypothetical protein [Desulfovibrio sp. DV]OLN24342.1 hypothetical protein DVDV_4321 [Desulfovibrio sp. DV]
MPYAVRILTAALCLLCAAPAMAQAKTGKRCFFVGGYPAAETRELLAKAQALTDQEDDAGLTALRAQGTVLIPQGKPAENVQCGTDGLCQVTVYGKRLWMLQNGLQCP